MNGNVLMVMDDQGITNDGEHESTITLEELKKSANRVEVLAEMLWAEVKDYNTAYEEYRKQWHINWDKMTKDEQDAIPKNKSLAHLILPRIGITGLGGDKLASIYMESEGPPLDPHGIDTIWNVRCPACGALPGYSCTGISGQRRDPHHVRKEEYLDQT